MGVDPTPAEEGIPPGRPKINRGLAERSVEIQTRHLRPYCQAHRGEAIDTLERAIAPSCSPAGCRSFPKHVPSLRSPAGLYLDRDAASAKAP